MISSGAGMAKRYVGRHQPLTAPVAMGRDVQAAGRATGKPRQMTLGAALQWQDGVAQLEQAQWQREQTTVKAPVDGWVTNLSARTGNYATAGQPVVALVDSHSFYVVGYFEETKLRHIREGDTANIVLYSGNITLQGHVSSIGRAIYDQSVETDSGLVPDIKPNVPWVRLAQRVPVRVEFDTLPDDITLVSGTTCTVSIGTR